MDQDPDDDLDGGPAVIVWVLVLFTLTAVIAYVWGPW